MASTIDQMFIMPLIVIVEIRWDSLFDLQNQIFTEAGGL
jgi:hypothetical protein